MLHVCCAAAAAAAAGLCIHAYKYKSLVEAVHCPPTQTIVTCHVQAGDVYWSLGQHVACVRNGERAFSFSVPEADGLYLTLVLYPGETACCVGIQCP